MYLRGLTNATLDIASNPSDANDDDGYDEDIGGVVIAGLFILFILCCICRAIASGGCDSNDTDGSRVHRANLRRAARGQGPYA